MTMQDTELLAILDAHRRQSIGGDSTDISQERAAAMDHYHGRPYGDEQKGRSQVVSKDLSDTIGWIMPAVMKTFLQGGTLAEFAPAGPEDEEAALQQSEYVNHVIMKDNPGFILMHDLVKDTLLLKNGYIKHWWDESEIIREVEYSNLSEMELAQLMQELEQEGEVEVLEQEAESLGLTNSVDAEGNLVEEFQYEVKLRLTKKTNRVRIEATPAEEIRISTRARYGTQDSTYIEHVTVKTRTDLIEMGMDEDFVNSLPAYNSSTGDKQEHARDSVSDESANSGDAIGFDRSMDEIEYGEAYVRVDYDGDGKAELRRIITCGNKIPPGDEWNEVVDCVAITSMVSKRVPHRHIGESLDDDLADLQKIKTVLTRQLLDNVYLTNNQQTVINELAHIPDFLQSLPGGIKRVKTDGPVTGMVEPLVTTPIMNQVLPAIDYIDTVKDSRTGVNKLTTDVDPDVLKDTTKGAFMEGINRASQKVEMLIRMMAETGVKELVLRVHELLLKHQDKSRIVKLRGKYVEINPTEWRERTDLTVKVGLGTGTEEERRQKLALVSSLQDKMIQAGLVGPQQAYKLFNDMLETMGLEASDKYAIDPDSDEYKQMVQASQNQQQPNPLAEVEQVKGEYQLQSQQMANQYKLALEQMKADYEQAKKLFETQARASDAEADRLSRETIEAAKLEIKAMLEGFKIDLGRSGIGEGLQ